MFEKLDWEGEKEWKQTSKQTKNLCNAAVTKILEEKEFKRKIRGSQIPCLGAFVPELESAKINISKEEKAGDSACCGAGDLDVGAEESFQGTEGHCAWNAKASAALRQENAREPPELAESRAWNCGEGKQGWKEENGAHCGHPLPAPASRDNGHDRGKVSKRRD